MSRADQHPNFVGSPQNVVLELTPGGPAEYDLKLLVDDVVVGMDGLSLVDSFGNVVTKLQDVLASLPAQDVHYFRIRRDTLSRAESKIGHMNDDANNVAIPNRVSSGVASSVSAWSSDSHRCLPLRNEETRRPELAAGAEPDVELKRNSVEALSTTVVLNEILAELSCALGKKHPWKDWLLLS